MLVHQAVLTLAAVVRATGITTPGAVSDELVLVTTGSPRQVDDAFAVNLSGHCVGTGTPRFERAGNEDPLASGARQVTPIVRRRFSTFVGLLGSPK